MNRADMKILLVEDDDHSFVLYRGLLIKLGIPADNIRRAISGGEASQMLRRLPNHFHGVITDMRMEGGSGLTLLQEMRTMGTETSVLVHSSSYFYKDTEGNTGKVDLAQLPEFFTFVWGFHIKMLRAEDTQKYFEEFLTACST